MPPKYACPVWASIISKNPPPSPRCMPVRRASKGSARPGLLAPRAENPASVSGDSASIPPATTARTRPVKQPCAFQNGFAPSRAGSGNAIGGPRNPCGRAVSAATAPISIGIHLSGASSFRMTAQDGDGFGRACGSVADDKADVCRAMPACSASSSSGSAAEGCEPKTSGGASKALKSRRSGQLQQCADPLPPNRFRITRTSLGRALRKGLLPTQAAGRIFARTAERREQSCTAYMTTAGRKRLLAPAILESGSGERSALSTGRKRHTKSIEAIGALYWAA